MVTGLLLVGALALGAVSVLLVLRRQAVGAVILAWSPLVKRRAEARRVSPEQLRAAGSRFAAIPAAVIAAIWAVALVAGAIARR